MLISSYYIPPVTDAAAVVATVPVVIKALASQSTKLDVKYVNSYTEPIAPPAVATASASITKFLALEVTGKVVVRTASRADTVILPVITVEPPDVNPNLNGEVAQDAAAMIFIFIPTLFAVAWGNVIAPACVVDAYQIKSEEVPVKSSAPVPDWAVTLVLPTFANVMSVICEPLPI